MSLASSTRRGRGGSRLPVTTTTPASAKTPARFSDTSIISEFTASVYERKGDEQFRQGLPDAVGTDWLIESTQAAFDEAQQFRNGPTLTEQGRVFSEKIGEISPSRFADADDILITVAVPGVVDDEDDDTQAVDGDYLASGLLAFWRVATTANTKAIPAVVPGQPVDLEFLCFSSRSLPSSDALDPAELAYVGDLVSTRSVVVPRCPDVFLVIRSEASSLRASILSGELAGSARNVAGPSAAGTTGRKRRRGQIQSSNSSIPLAGAPPGESSPSLSARSAWGSVADGNGPGDSSTVPAGSKQKVIPDLDGRTHAVLDQNDASSRAKDLQVVLRLAPENRYNDFGINRYFKLTADDLRSTIEHHSRRARTLCEDEIHWKSAGGLSFMIGADVFSSPMIFTAALKGEMEWRAVYALSLKSFHHGGPATVFVSLERLVSTPVFRRQLGECFSGLERWLRIVFTNDYAGVMQPIVDFLMEDEDPCEGIPDAYVFHVANSGVAHIFQVLRSEARTPAKSLAGPQRCFAFLQSKLHQIVDQLRAAASLKGTREINSFFATDVTQIQWRDPSLVTSPQPKGASGTDQESRRGSAKKKSKAAAPQPSQAGITTRNLQKQRNSAGNHGSAKLPAGVPADEAPSAAPQQRNAALCVYHLIHLLGAAAKDCNSGDQCNYSHDFGLSHHTQQDFATIIKQSRLTTHVRAAAMKALKDQAGVFLAPSK